jgi:hypothetical protein
MDYGYSSKKKDKWILKYITICLLIFATFWFLVWLDGYAKG